MELPDELAFDRLSGDERGQRAMVGYMKRIRDLYAAIHKRFGEDGLELIREVSREYGTRVGRNAAKKGDMRGLVPVGRYLLRVFDMVSDDWEVSEFGPERLVIRVSRCPYPFESEEICQAHTCMEAALVAALDGDLDYRVGCSIPAGDQYCEHVLSCKRGAGGGSPPRSAV